MRWVVALIASLLLVLVAPSAAAQSPIVELGVAAGPSPTSFMPGMIEVFARIENPSGQTLAGEIVVRQVGSPIQSPLGRSAFSIGPREAALVRLPISTDRYALVVEADAAGEVLASKQLSPDSQGTLRIVDVVEVSRMRAAVSNMQLRSAPVSPPTPQPSASSTTVSVATPYFDPASGRPVLPTRVASWHGVSLVMISASALARLPAEELRALTGHVLSGGTLALSIDKPEDLRLPVVSELVGGVAVVERANDVTLAPITPPLSDAEVKSRYGQPPDRPGEDVSFVSYSGGRLVGSVYGAGADVGLGQVVLLGFNPNAPEAAEDGFVQLRVVELARSASERVRIAAVRPGALLVDDAGFGPLRRGFGANNTLISMLDPNTSATWSIGIASLFLCLYAIAAGPISFHRYKSKNRPLVALFLLPVFSVGAFLCIVLFGFLSKGVSRKANVLTFVEVGAGRSEGSSRQFRGFFSPFAQTLSIRPRDPSSMLALAIEGDIAATFEADGGGVRLESVESMPSQTIVLRDDGLTSLDGSIAIEPSPDLNQVVVTNGTPHDLRAVIAALPNGDFRYHPLLAAGQSVSTAEMSLGDTMFSRWASIQRRPSAVPKAGLDGTLLRGALERQDEPEAGELWAAIDQSSPPLVDWFPTGVPVVLGVIDRGLGPDEDTGIAVQRDLAVVRVVGFGGAQP